MTTSLSLMTAGSFRNTRNISTRKTPIISIARLAIAKFMTIVLSAILLALS